MSNQDQTALSAPEVRNAGTAIGDIAADVNGFSELNDVHPKAGEFAVGSWLNELITSRRDSLYQHCTELQKTLQEVSNQLKSIATDIEQVDQNNAEQMNKLNTELQSTVGQMQKKIGTVAPNLSESGTTTV